MAPVATTYSVPELAEMLKVAPVKIRGWIESGELPAVNLGNGRRRPRYAITEDANPTKPAQVV